MVEVADSSLVADLETKSRVYGRSGYPVYRVVHRGGVEVLTEPYEAGCRHHLSVPPGGSVEVPYLPGGTVAVDVILDAEP